MAKGGQCFEKVGRCIRTLFFMVAMLASLLVTSLPVLVAMGDVLATCVLIPNFTCVKCYGFKEHLRRYAFKSSLTDIPIVSVIRSIIIICVYLMCDAPALSHGPYLGTVTLCSFFSILLLSVKACFFTVNSQIEAEASSSISRQKLHLKKSWGMPVLFLSSVVFALGHTVVAYRTSCRARRKLFFHRVDPEAVLSCKNVFSGYQKVPRSPIPSGGKTPKSDSEMRQKPLGTARDEKLPLRLLADLDSLFITCQGLTLHYKLSLPGSPPRSLSSKTLLESNSSIGTPEVAGGRPKFDRHKLSMSSKSQHALYRSYSNQFNRPSLYAPLLDSFAYSPVLSEEIPVLSLDEEIEVNKLKSLSLDKDLEGIGQFGIVLVHGFGGGVFSWRHVMGPLAWQIGCTVAAFDRPGWGLTSRPRQEDWQEKDLPNPYRLETQVDLLLAFCSEMGFSSVVLVGHDDGGLLALKVAQRVHASTNSFNVTIKGVVLLNVSLSREVVPSFARILLHTSLGKKHLVRPLLRTEITQVVNRHAWYDATKLTTEVLSLYKAPLCVEGWDEALHEIGKLSNEIVLSAQNADSLLKAMEDVPVLVIAGAEDALVSLKSSQSMASKLVNSRLVAISGCGHLPHEECPKALLAAISPFIRRLPSTSDLQRQ
ncbi:Alpha/beta hydrolase-like [Quillaja saponaria]|uniref:Alpha/beta hydrolase-like n=1 Tax=Quillaja saponaria TaxID=32244 RepID=A0AAD7PDS6_QUISA|nr:Alpha/beta hydrolase-like [Quillaja saponaria]